MTMTAFFTFFALLAFFAFLAHAPGVWTFGLFIFIAVFCCIFIGLNLTKLRTRDQLGCLTLIELSLLGSNDWLDKLFVCLIFRGHVV